MFPDWARWAPGAEDWTLGVEEEVMLLDPGTGQLAHAVDDVIPALGPQLRPHVTPETHASALELATGVHRSVDAAAAELGTLRRSLASCLDALGLAAGVAGTHPSAQWQQTQVSAGARYRLLHGSLRELARREPTFALHVHVGIADPERACAVAGRMRAHLPLLLALSANSPFWQGRDSGMASVRTPVFQAFPRSGMPRRFPAYEAWVQAVAPLIAAEAIPEPTFLWWDVRLQPRIGTVEVRIMDAQTTVADTAALVALVQSLVALEDDEGFADEVLLDADEVLAENRFIAARDGMEARFVDPVARRSVPVRQLLAEVLDAAGPYAARLGCADALAGIEALAGDPPAARRREDARTRHGLAGVVTALEESFLAGVAAAALG